MERIVLDTSTIVSAFRSRHGASHALLRSIAAGDIRPLATLALFLEYEGVLKRPEQRLAHGFGIAEIDAFLAGFASACVGVDVNFRWRPQLSDPDDELVLEAAVNGGAEFIVTHNVKDFARVAPTFGVTAVRPGAYLKRRMQ